MCGDCGALWCVLVVLFWGVFLGCFCFCVRLLRCVWLCCAALRLGASGRVLCRVLAASLTSLCDPIECVKYHDSVLRCLSGCVGLFQVFAL